MSVPLVFDPYSQPCINTNGVILVNSESIEKYATILPWYKMHGESEVLSNLSGNPRALLFLKVPMSEGNGDDETIDNSKYHAGFSDSDVVD